MAHFKVFVDISPEQIVKAKFEQQLEKLVRNDLIEKLAEEMVASKEFKINHLQLSPSLDNPYLAKIRFYLDADIY